MWLFKVYFVGVTVVANVHLNWLNWFSFIILAGDQLVILIGFMIDSVVDDVKMSMVIVSFFV